jgi:hypothetical protein
VFGAGGAADDSLIFEDQHVPTGPGEEGGGDQAVVAGAEDDDIARSLHDTIVTELRRPRGARHPR